LNEARARLWQTNLAAVFEMLTGSRASAIPGDTNGWQLRIPRRQPGPPMFLELARTGGWTVLGVGDETNVLAAEMLALIEQDGQPFARQRKEFWLYADVDLRRVASALSLEWRLPADLPRLTLSAIGDGENVRTTGRFNFPAPLPFKLEPWNIPTNLIHERLVSFTVIQGVRPWLSSLKIWNDLRAGPPPNQLCFWAQSGLPTLSFFAAPLPGASSQVHALTECLLQKADPWMATNGLGRFERATNFPGVVWSGLILASPYLKAVSAGGSDFAFAGLDEAVLTNRPPPAELLQQILTRTNLVAYDWELTGPRLEQWLYFAQMLRFALHQAQLPAKSASIAWFETAKSHLGNCVTAVTRTGPAQLSFVRRSSSGFTAAEINWLADWLESPQFPRGLNTFLGEPTPLPHKRARRPGSGSSTNSPPAVRH
jgi:hypothetical protein